MGLSGGTQTINRLFTYDATYRLTGESFTASGPVGLPSSTALGYDGHNSVRYLTDGSGNITDPYDYDAYGNLIARTGSTENN